MRATLLDSRARIGATKVSAYAPERSKPLMRASSGLVVQKIPMTHQLGGRHVQTPAFFTVRIRISNSSVTLKKRFVTIQYPSSQRICWQGSFGTTRICYGLGIVRPGILCGGHDIDSNEKILLRRDARAFLVTSRTTERRDGFEFATKAHTSRFRHIWLRISGCLLPRVSRTRPCH